MIPFLKVLAKPRVAVHDCNPSIQEAEASGLLWVRGQTPSAAHKTLSLKKESSVS